jgi:hypothetical protein
MLLGAAAGCGLGAEPPAALVQIVPAMAYNDAPVVANIYGSAFRPAYQFDTMAGSAGIEVGGFSATLVSRPPPTQPSAQPSMQPSMTSSASFPLTGVTWVSVDILSATVPSGLPSGQYDLVVGDPRAHSARLPQAFTSLGVDTTPPSVTIESPADGSLIGATAPVDVVVAADDGYGVLTDLQVTITAGTAAPWSQSCSLTGGARASCAFSFPAPAPAAGGDMLSIDAQATGSGGLTQKTRVSVQLLPAPVPTGISPVAGSTLGGTAVTLSGADFVAAGATTVAFDGQVALLYEVTPTSLTALTPPHAAGPVTVTVTTGGATATLTGSFTYLPPPTVREVSPTSGPPSGFTPITIVGENFHAATTVITFDGKLLVCPTFVNANRIEGLTPPGMGTETIEASDALGGSMPGADVPFEYLTTGGDAAADGATDAAVDAVRRFVAPLTPDGGCPGSSGP